MKKFTTALGVLLLATQAGAMEKEIVKWTKTTTGPDSSKVKSYATVEKHDLFDQVTIIADRKQKEAEILLEKKNKTIQKISILSLPKKVDKTKIIHFFS